MSGKKKQSIIYVLLWILILFLPIDLNAQTANSSLQLVIPEVALLDIEPAGNNNITITPQAPDEAGDALVLQANTDTWMNYTSCVTPTGNRKIMVQITGGILPPGMNVTVQVNTLNTPGSGVCGASSSVVTLSPAAKDFITGIKGCFTGNGTNHGAQLKYNLSYSNYSDLRSGTFGPLQLTYTFVSY